MINFIQYLVSFDAFGEPITLNYKGSSTYKTGVGAFFTVVMFETFGSCSRIVSTVWCRGFPRTFL